MVSLGCSKNTVDAEILMGRLRRIGGRITGDPAAADVIIVNTCGFLAAAREEGIDAIREMAGFKSRGRLRTLIITGCMVPEHAEEIRLDVPGVDRIVSPFRHDEIIGMLTSEESPPVSAADRLFVTPVSYGYLKISDGCDNRCAYCRIPALRGAYRSFPLDDVIAHGRRILETGRKEIVVISQDCTRYGTDYSFGPHLEDLLEKLAELPGDFRLRVMYLYPSRVSDRLLQLVADHPKICRYLDIPFQHIDSRVLRRMNRDYDESDVRNLMDRIQRFAPEIAVRTTLMTGFPGEDEQAFRVMERFVGEGRLDHLGVFVFSPEPGTPAVSIAGRVPSEIAEIRRDRLMRIQQPVSLARNREKIGCRREVLVDGPGDGGHSEGRLETQAPEVDGITVLEGSFPPGSRVWAEIYSVDEYDCRARPVVETSTL